MSCPVRWRRERRKDNRKWSWQKKKKKKELRLFAFCKLQDKITIERIWRWKRMQSREKFCLVLTVFSDHFGWISTGDSSQEVAYGFRDGQTRFSRCAFGNKILGSHECLAFLKIKEDREERVFQKNVTSGFIFWPSFHFCCLASRRRRCSRSFDRSD